MCLLSVSKTACIEALLLIQWAELVAEHQQEGAARFAHPILFEHFVCTVFERAPSQIFRFSLTWCIF